MQMAISLLANLATCPGQLYFRRSYFFTLLWLLRHNSYSFGASISSEQLLFLRCSVFDRVISLHQLFFQNTLFSGMKLLPSSHFVRIGSSLGQLLFGTATFLLEWLLRINISTEELLWSKQVLLHSISFFRRATFSKNLLFLESYLFRAVTFSKYVTFYSSNIFRRATLSQHMFSEELLFHIYASSPQLHLLFIC